MGPAMRAMGLTPEDQKLFGKIFKEFLETKAGTLTIYYDNAEKNEFTISIKRTISDNEPHPDSEFVKRILYAVQKTLYQTVPKEQACHIEKIIDSLLYKIVIEFPFIVSYSRGLNRIIGFNNLMVLVNRACKKFYKMKDPLFINLFQELYALFKSSYMQKLLIQVYKQYKIADTKQKFRGPNLQNETVKVTPPSSSSAQPASLPSSSLSSFLTTTDVVDISSAVIPMPIANSLIISAQSIEATRCTCVLL